MAAVAGVVSSYSVGSNLRFLGTRRATRAVSDEAIDKEYDDEEEEEDKDEDNTDCTPLAMIIALLVPAVGDESTNSELVE